MPRALFAVTVPFTAKAFLREQMAWFTEHGWDVVLVTSDGPEASMLSTEPGPEVRLVPMTRNPSPAKDLRSLASWLAVLRATSPDIVVAGTPKAGLLGMLASWTCRVPCRVYHARGLRAESLKGPALYISLIAEWLACACSTEVLCDSPSLLTEMRRRRLVSPSKGIVLGAGSASGVDTVHFRPPNVREREAIREYLGFRDQDFVVGFIGRLAWDKGVRELVVALSELRRQHSNTRLLMVGPVEDPGIVEFLRAEGSTWITHIDYMSDPRDMYWALDLFCLVSYREGFPIAVLEATSSGLCVVVSDATGCRDAVIPGQTGFVVPVGDSNALAACLSEVISTPDIRHQIGLNARHRAHTEFRSALVTRNFWEFINNSFERSTRHTP